MSDYHRDPTRPVARKRHQCDGCLHWIPVGERYVNQTGVYDGSAYNNHFHEECHEALRALIAEWGDGEFMPGEIDPPARVLAAEAAQQQKDQR